MARTASSLRWALLAAVLLAETAVATSYSIIIPVKAIGSGPLFRIQRHGKWGYANRSGQIVIPPRFTHAQDFFDGLAAVQSGKKWGYIRQSGDFAIPPRFDKAMDFQQERAVVIVNGRAGLIDPSGAFIVSPRFQEIRPFSDGLAAVWIDAKSKGEEIVWIYGGRWGFIDREGRMVIEPQIRLGKRLFRRTSRGWSKRQTKRGRRRRHHGRRKMGLHRPQGNNGHRPYFRRSEALLRRCGRRLE